MTSRQLKICCLVALFASACIASCSSNEVASQSNTTAIVVDRNKQTSPDTKVSGSISPVRYNGEDLKQFTLSQPLPEIWLSLKENNNTNAAGEVKITLSEEARQILYQHWVKTLKHNYITEVEEISKDVNYQKEDSLLVQSTFDTKNKLLNVPINFGNKSRNFSAEETSQLVIFIRDASSEIIDEIKKIKNQN